MKLNLYILRLKNAHNRYKIFNLEESELTRDLKKLKSVEELKQFGSVTEIVQLFEKIVFPLRVHAESYEELFEVLLLLREKWVDMCDGFFCSKQKEFTFYLTKLEGKQRNHLIGLTDDLFEDKALLKNWYRNLTKIIHPDVNNDELSELAFNTLNELYQTILETFKEDNSDE